MKKEEFLKSLQARLVERGLSEDAANKETEHVNTYLAESSMDEVDISIDEMVDGILNMLEENKEGEYEDIDIAPIPMVSEENDESVSDELSAAIAAIDADATDESSDAAAIPIVTEEIPEEIEEGIQINKAEQVSDLEPIPEQTIEPEIEAEEIELIQTEEESAPVLEDQESVDLDEPSEAAFEEEPAPAQEEEPKAVEASAPQPKQEKQGETAEIVPDEEDTDIEKYIPYNQKVKMKKIENSKKGGNEWLYVMILVITIPIAVALILTAAVLYLGFWVVLSLAMIACIAALIVFVAAFALVSIVGIVYGVVELIIGHIPVGLFEIGLGVMIGAAVMFIGILVYNFAVRFIPFVMKLLARLFRAGFRGIRNGYQILKGAVEEI